MSHPANTPRQPIPIEITDDRARVDVIQLSHAPFLLLTKDKHSFYERFGFRSEPDQAMMLRR